MALGQNPFVAGPPVGRGRSFVGRTAIIDRVHEVLRRPGDVALVLFGQRRIGKTSILQNLARHLPDAGDYHPVLFDLQDKASQPLGQVLSQLALAIADAADLEEPDLGADPEAAFTGTFLPAALSAIGEAGALVILFDEFDVLADPGTASAARAFFPYLRALIDGGPTRLKLVFVIGRNIADLESRALSLFKGMQSVEVALLPRAEMEELVRLSERTGSLRWEPEAIERVWALTHGHPLLTQQLCSVTWELLHRGDPEESPVVTEGDIDDKLVGAVLSGSRNTLEWLWDGLGPAPRVVASALAAAGPQPISPTELEQILQDSGVRVVVRELQKAPKLLQEWGIIEPTTSGFRFKVELLRRWVAENKPVERVQEELDLILPAAENLYLAAESLFQAGQVTEALPLLRQAVRLNQNHIRATELLVDVLVSQGERAEARRLLEGLLQFQPRSARHRLIQVLLADLEELTETEPALDLIRRILELAPAQAVALRRRAELLRGRGRARLSQGDPAGALADLREAGDLEGVEEATRALRKAELDRALRSIDELDASGRPAEALGALDRLREAYPEFDLSERAEQISRKGEAATRFEQAMTALQQGDRPGAVRGLIEAVRADPSHAQASEKLQALLKDLEPIELQAAMEDLQDSVAASLNEREAVRQRLAEVEEASSVRISQLTAELQSLSTETARARALSTLDGEERGDALAARIVEEERTRADSLARMQATLDERAKEAEELRATLAALRASIDHGVDARPRWRIRVGRLIVSLAAVTLVGFLIRETFDLGPTPAGDILGQIEEGGDSRTILAETLLDVGNGLGEGGPAGEDLEGSQNSYRMACLSGSLLACVRGELGGQQHARCGKEGQEDCLAYAQRVLATADEDEEYALAADALGAACDDRRAEACADLGDLYALGRSLQIDQIRASRLYKAACEGGFAEACTTWGDRLVNGLGVSADVERGREVFKAACDKDRVASSCRMLGDWFRDGRGGEVELVRAFYHYQEACELGQGEACLMAASFGVEAEQSSEALTALLDKGCALGDHLACESRSTGQEPEALARQYGLLTQQAVASTPRVGRVHIGKAQTGGSSPASAKGADLELANWSDPIQDCYLRALEGDPILHGRGILWITANVGGKVTAAQVLRDPPKGPVVGASRELDDCIEGVLREARFPANGEGYNLRYPIRFTQQGERD